jgi:tetratricopeptide (TPR) repeat protein
MTMNNRWIPALLLLAALSASPLAAAGDLKTRAEEAFRNDRYPEAIDLYRQILAASPNDTFALKRLALVLSYENRLGESIETYKKLLALEPSDDEAKRELAKIESWDGRFTESEALYRELILAHPEDATLKLSLAEILAWQGKMKEARAIYQPLIDSHDHAVEAAAGMGDVAAWEGNLEEAARWYRQVLKVDPHNEKAAVGLARVHHWQGKDRIAVMEVDQAVQKFPDSRGAQKAHDEIHETLRPSLTPSFDRIIDTDSNDLSVSRLCYNLHTDPQSTVDVLYAHYDATFRCDVAGHCQGVLPGTPLPTDVVNESVDVQGDSIAAAYSTRFSDILYLNARLGFDRQDSFDGDRLTRMAGVASFDAYPRQTMGFGASVTRESLFDTARLIDNHLALTSANGRYDWKFKPRWRWRIGAQHAWFSDDNSRNVLSTSVEWRAPLPRPRLRLTYFSRWLSYDHDPGDGYFAPQQFWANLLTVSAGGDLLHRKLYYGADLTGGYQTINHGNRDSVFGYELLAGWNIIRRLAFEASYGKTNYAQQIASGFESHHYGFLLKITF